MSVYDRTTLTSCPDEDGSSDVSIQFALFDNYPNPFNARTTICYQLPLSSDVRLGIYDLLGQKVATLTDEHQQAGEHNVTWDASAFSSGIYFCKLTAGDYTHTKRMMLVK
jgi:hypothetical protein